MKYLFLALSLCISVSSFADKKKTKEKNNKTAISKSNAGSGDDGSMVTANTNMQTSDNYKNKLESTRIESPLFNFKCRDTKNRSIDQNTFNDKNLIIMLYNPDCGHCMEVAHKILENLESMPNTHWILMSGENTEPVVPEFMRSVGINEEDSRITLALIDKETTEAIFEYNGIPQVMVYGEQRTLRKVFYKDIDLNEFTKLFDR